MNDFLMHAPGFGRRYSIRQVIELGRELRDDLLWDYPILPDAVYIDLQISSGFRWKVSGSARAVARAVEWINNAQTLTYDGLVDTGFEQFLNRRRLDHLCIGRKLFTWGKDEPLRYLDPADCTYNFGTKEWLTYYTGEHFPVSQVVVNHPIPIGVDGYFSAPLAPIIPTAMLAWLIREHDRATADGRKIRDITIVIGQELADQIKGAIDNSLKLWAGEDPTKIGVPLVYAEPGDANIKATDLVTRIGLANIPEAFDRDAFAFSYANEIAAATGLALRQFWNSEKATNRALEQVQEARANMKGPASFVQTEQRLLNQCGALKQFGPSTRFNIIEEVDAASQQIRAQVLLAYAQSLQIFTSALGANLDVNSLIAWFQSEDILPSDLAILANVTQTNSEDSGAPSKPGDAIGQSDAITPPDQPQKAAEIDYDEISMNQDGQVIERRPRVFSFEKFIHYTPHPPAPAITFESALKRARDEQSRRFLDLYDRGEKWLDTDLVADIISRRNALTDEDHRHIKTLLDGNPNARPEDGEAVRMMENAVMEGT